MDRKTFVVGLASMLASLGFSRGDSSLSPQQAAMAEAMARNEESRRQAIAMNSLAGNIRSLADARALVDEIARIFADDLPPMWASRSARNRVAKAEFQAATDPAQLIPEDRVAAVWNQYIAEIAAPRDSLVNAAEIHNLRDASYASGQLFWARGNKSIWTMSNIYALGPGGKVADGCRALESLRMIYDLARQPEIIQGARDRVQEGILVSEVFRRSRENPASTTGKSGFVTIREVAADPIELAQARYINQYGASRLMGLANDWFEELFPA